MASDDSFIADRLRLESWAGEFRVNLLRAIGLVAFYGHHLFNYFGPGRSEELTALFHATVTSIVLIWSFMILLLHICLSRRYWPDWLKYASLSADLALITLMLMATRDGPHSGLMFLYFLVIASAPLRLSLPLVYLATLGSMACGVILVGHQYFYLIGPEAYAKSSERIARTTQTIFLLALGGAGLFAGQIVRQALRLVQGYAVTVDESEVT